MFSGFKSSNPVFSKHFWNDQNEDAQKFTVGGVFMKSMFCFALIVLSSVFIWDLFSKGVTNLKWYTTGGLIVAVLCSILISFKPKFAKYLVPIYALSKGLFLGGVSCYAHQQFPYLPFQAVGITILAFLVMLILYQTRIIVVTKELRSIITSSVIIIMFVYLISFILGFFGIHLTFLWDTSWTGFAFNIFAAITASFALLLDFEHIEKHKNKSDKKHEWIAVWGLLVTLIWLYFEVLRLLKKFAIRF